MPSKRRSSTIKNQDVAAATFVVGSDLEVADFTNIQTAIDNLPPQGGTIFILEGTYTITATLTLPAKPVRLVGAGRNATVVALGGNAITGTKQVEFIGISFTGTAGSSITVGGGGGVESEGSYFEDCYFDGIPTITMNGLSSRVVGCSFISVNLVLPAQRASVVGSTFAGTVARLNITGSKACVVGCDFDGSLATDFGIVLSTTRCKVVGCSFNNHTSGGISVTSTSNVITGCSFSETVPVLESGGANTNFYSNNTGFYPNSTIIGATSVIDNQQTRQTTTTPYTVVATDRTILIDATAGAKVVDLPTAASSKWRILTIKKIDASANVVTVDGNGAETIDGAATYVLTAQYEAVTVQSDGTTWWVI